MVITFRGLLLDGRVAGRIAASRDLFTGNVSSQLGQVVK